MVGGQRGRLGDGSGWTAERSRRFLALDGYSDAAVEDLFEQVQAQTDPYVPETGNTRPITNPAATLCVLSVTVGQLCPAPRSHESESDTGRVDNVVRHRGGGHITASYDGIVSAVDIQGLEVAFGTHRAVDGLDLQVRAGTTCVLLGPPRCRQDNDPAGSALAPTGHFRSARLLGLDPGDQALLTLGRGPAAGRRPARSGQAPATIVSHFASLYADRYHPPR